jgi:ATP-dependent DNA ligase
MEARPGIAGIEYPVRPMTAVTAQELPTSHPGGWAAEPKLDGFRCIAHRGDHRVALQSRQQRRLTGYFPEIAAALAELDVEVVLDGELVLWREGRLDFAALQQRLYPAASRARRLSLEMPAAYVVFDLLAVDGTDIRPEPYSARRALLEDLLARQLPHGLVPIPMTKDFAVARTWVLDHTSAGVEGVVAKRLDAPYRANGKTWVKIRTRMTADAIVGGVLGSLERPEALILGRPDRHGRLRVAGCTTPLPRAARTEIAAVLTPAAGGHPWPPTIPSGRFGRLDGTPIDYVQVAPTVVVELDVDVSFEHHRWRHGARFVRIRRDLKVSDVVSGGSEIGNGED